MYKLLLLAPLVKLVYSAILPPVRPCYYPSTIQFTTLTACRIVSSFH